MNIWTNWDKQQPPKQVVFLADFGDYTDKCIIDYKKRLWSETEKIYLLEKPLRWKVSKY